MIILNLSLLLVRNSAITFPSCTEYKNAIGIRNKDFVSFFITLECRITTFIVTDLFYHGHENIIVGHCTALFLDIFLLLCFLLQEQHRGLSTISRLEGIHMKVYTGNDSVVFNKPLSNISKARCTQNIIRENDAHTSARNK